MLKTYSEALTTFEGATMGTHWSVSFDAGIVAPIDLYERLDAVITKVDSEMSTWKPQSALMQFNHAPLGVWRDLPSDLISVLLTSMELHNASKGAFDPNVGALIRAWGFFGDKTPDANAISQCKIATHVPFHDAVEIDAANNRARKHAQISLDLSGIAKGFGVDKLRSVLIDAGIEKALVSLDGELSAMGIHPSGAPWTIGLEMPNDDVREVGGIIEAENISIATSGDYRHFHMVNGRRISHTMNLEARAPLQTPIASVTVMHESCMMADGLATAAMVLGEEKGKRLLARFGAEGIFQYRQESKFH